MQRPNFALLTFLAVSLCTLSSCEFLGGIFKAGIWTGLLIVAVIIAILIWVISRFRK